MRKLRRICRSIETLKGSRGLKTYLQAWGLRNYCFKQQNENPLVITEKNNEPNQKLTEMVVGEWVQ